MRAKHIKPVFFSLLIMLGSCGDAPRKQAEQPATRQTVRAPFQAPSFDDTVRKYAGADSFITSFNGVGDLIDVFYTGEANKIHFALIAELSTNTMFFYNIRDGRWQPPDRISHSSDYDGFRMTDLDHDGYRDIVFFQKGGWQAAFVYKPGLKKFVHEHEYCKNGL